MGKDLCEAFPAARALFDRADAVTGLPISQLSFNGPDEDLAATNIAQPAIFTMSAAMLACMPEALVTSLAPSYYAGLSLGEYTALYAAGMIDFEDALRLVAKRGSAMQAAAEASDSTMVALIGMDEESATKLCDAVADGQILTPANFNCPGQVVISGESAACKRAMEQAEEFGARGATELNVAGAFHSELMAPAAKELSEAIAGVDFRPAEGKTILANVNAKSYAGPADFAEHLLAQLTGAVRWQQCCEAMLADGVDTFYEIGPGKVLAGLMRRIDRKAKVVVLNSKDALEKALELA
jgi:[acyl-carrier-protein] S-malonyltransferase